MMKSVSIYKVILIVILCIAVFLPSLGCSFSQMGQTTAEGHRRHIRTWRIDQKELMADIDRFLMLDEPSKLTEMRIP
jgi:hypothetical protein